MSPWILLLVTRILFHTYLAMKNCYALNQDILEYVFIEIAVKRDGKVGEGG